MIITHNIVAQNVSKNLNQTNKAYNNAMAKLSSGYQVNQAADNAAGLAISEKMRAQIRGLQRASMNVKDGISLTNVADSGLNEFYSILQRERELMIQSANDTNCDTDREAIEMEIQALTSELDRLFDQTEFNTIKIFQGKDTILSPPVTTIETDTLPDIETKNETSNKSVIWISKADIALNGEPQDEINNVTTISKSYSSTYTETEEAITGNGDTMHPSYQLDSEYMLITTTTTTVSEISKTYTKKDTDPDYTTLQKPGNMVGKNGYINITNVKNNLSLSCAMSQLGLVIDGNVMSVDLYQSGNVVRNTVVSDDESTATTTYTFSAPSFEVDQIITLTDNGTAYEISYAVRNTDTEDHEITLRLAFDVMNVDSKHLVSTTDGVDKLPFNLENDDAIITITAPDVSDACLTNIEALYDVADKSKVDPDRTGISHTGAGFWWSDKDVAASSELSFGPVKYGPIELKKIPYEVLDETKDNITISTEIEKTLTTLEYKPEYLDIQAGANSFQMIPIRLWDLSTERLKCTTPQEISAFSPQDALLHIDRVIDMISSIRSYYGAMTNRMEHAYLNNDNTAENLTNAESRIRDTDMAAEMVNFSKSNILAQAGSSILAQANSSTQGILTLLQ